MTGLRRDLEVQDSSIGVSLLVHEDVELLLKAMKGLEDEIPFVDVRSRICRWSWGNLQGWGWLTGRSDCRSSKVGGSRILKDIK